MSALFIIIFLLSVISANALLYLSHRHQACLPQALTALPWRYVAWCLHLLAFFVACLYLNPLAASFACLATSMLCLGLIPFTSLLVGKKHDPRHR